MDKRDWRNDGVKVVRAADLQRATAEGRGRAMAFDFASIGGSKVLMGTVSLPPNGRTGAHHHGTCNTAIYVTSGRSEIRWGEQLEYSAKIGQGDFVYFAPYVPHQEVNLDPDETLDLVVVRSEHFSFRADLHLEPIDHPEQVY